MLTLTPEGTETAQGQTYLLLVLTLLLGAQECCDGGGETAPRRDMGLQGRRHMVMHLLSSSGLFCCVCIPAPSHPDQEAESG